MQINKSLILVGTVIQWVKEDNFSDALWKNSTWDDRKPPRHISLFNSGYLILRNQENFKTKISTVYRKVRTNTLGQSLKNYFWWYF